MTGPAWSARHIAGMVAGADCIEDVDLLRHGGMDRLMSGVRAPSTLGTFLRAFTFGHVRQLDAVASRLLAALAERAPVLPGAAEVAYLDVDDTVLVVVPVQRRVVQIAGHVARRGTEPAHGLHHQQREVAAAAA